MGEFPTGPPVGEGRMAERGSGSELTWEAFAQAAPDIAAFARSQFDGAGMALIGTIRRDGTPRISSCQPCILEGRLYLGMLWQSRKALDLLHDPRITIRNAVCTNTGDEAEVTLRGIAEEVPDPAIRRRFMQAVADRTAWTEPFHLFSVAVSEASLVAYGNGRQSVELWPQDVKFTRPYG